MTAQLFLNSISKYSNKIEQIKHSAHAVHENVNQAYDKIHPYGYHLDMVVSFVRRYGHEVCAAEDDVLPIFFGAYYHDSIEDARLTYNDVMAVALELMSREQAFMSTEIVYALTNDKGRTRAERAGEHYYQGIREVPYAPFIKLADRMANITYSFHHDANEANLHMKEVYKKELPHFLAALHVDSPDKRFALPATMLDELQKIVAGK